MELRFFYNSDNNSFYNCDNSSHVIYYHNKKLPCKFDYYIRGIISDNILYLRVHYPYNDIDLLSYKELLYKSHELLKIYKKDILRAIKKNLNIKIDKTILNVTNDNLKGYLNNPYV